MGWSYFRERGRAVTLAAAGPLPRDVCYGPELFPWRSLPVTLLPRIRSSVLSRFFFSSLDVGGFAAKHARIINRSKNRGRNAGKI